MLKSLQQHEICSDSLCSWTNKNSRTTFAMFEFLIANYTAEKRVIVLIQIVFIVFDQNQRTESVTRNKSKFIIQNFMFCAFNTLYWDVKKMCTSQIYFYKNEEKSTKNNQTIKAAGVRN